MTHCTDVAATYLSNTYWYIDTGDMQPNNPSAETLTAVTNRGYITHGIDLARVGESSYLVDYIVTYVTYPYTCCPVSGCRSD